jgi:hypothetical protein
MNFNFDVFIPITLFICVTYTIKLIVDARVRWKMLRGGTGSEDLVRSMMQGEELRRRHASLRWGITLLTLAIGFGVIQLMGWTEINAGVVALLIGATGVGNVLSFVASRRFE